MITCMQTCQPPVLVVKTTYVRLKYLVDLMDILNTWSDFRPKIVKCQIFGKAISIALNTLKSMCMYKSIDCTTYSTYIPSLNIKLQYILFIYRQWSDIWGHDLRFEVWSPWKPCQQVDRSALTHVHTYTYTICTHIRVRTHTCTHIRYQIYTYTHNCH
jgi:hypothetical protein